MRTLITAITTALRAGDFSAAAALYRELPMGMRAFRRQKIKRPGKYIPGGAHANVSATRVKNPAIASQMNAMHEVWLAKRFA